MARLRDRRRRGFVVITCRLNQVEMRELVALGYFDPGPAEEGPGT